MNRDVERFEMLQVIKTFNDRFEMMVIHVCFRYLCGLRTKELKAAVLLAAHSTYAMVAGVLSHASSSTSVPTSVE